MWISDKTEYTDFELDEVYWYLNARRGHENGINTYIMTMISRLPRQIVGFEVDKSVNEETIQRIVSSVAKAERYYTDGCSVYTGVDFVGRHIQNFHDKSETHEIESTNSDLRHYIPGLARRSRCFYRSKETLEAVLSVFIDAYNKYGEAKQRHQIPVQHISKRKHLHKYRDLPFSFLDFL